MGPGAPTWLTAGLREDWALAYPNAHGALTKALLEACRFCADPAHWDEMAGLPSDRRHLGMKKELVSFGAAGGGEGQFAPHGEPHHQTFGPGVNRPSRTEHLWILTQLARWAEILFPRNYVEIIERICNLDFLSHRFAHDGDEVA